MSSVWFCWCVWREALSPHGLCYVTGDPINGEVFTNLRDPPPRGTNLYSSRGSGVQQPYKGATTLSSDRYDLILQSGSASLKLGHLDPVFLPYYANLKIFFRDFWGNSCLRFNKDIKFHPYKKHHLLRQQLKKKKFNNKTKKDISSSFLLDCINSEIFGHFIQIIKNTQS